MCYTATLPTVIKSENLNSDLLNLTRIFNRWLKMLTSYGKLDESSLQDDFTAIAKVVKSHETKKDLKRAVQRCRDYALAAVMQITDLVRSLASALNLLCKAQENKELRRVSSTVKVSRNSNSGRATHRLMIICPQFPVLTFSIPAPDLMRRRKPSTAPCSGARRKSAVALNCNFNFNFNIL